MTQPPTTPPESAVTAESSPAWRAWILPGAVLLLIVASILHYTNRNPLDRPDAFSWGGFTGALTVFIAYTLVAAMPALFVATLLLHLRRLLPLAYACLFVVALNLLCTGLYCFLLGRQPIAGSLTMLDLATIASNLCTLCALLGLMFIPILRPRGFRLQLTTAIALLTFYGTLVLLMILPRQTPYLFLDLLSWLRLPAAVVSLVTLPLVAYAGLRRRIPFAHQPPVDAGPDVALTCPRCGGAHRIPANGGQCPDCRLQIFIALAEGRCKSCGYALRSLTGEKCPECGTPFAPADPDKELLAWAAANERRPPPPAR